MKKLLYIAPVLIDDRNLDGVAKKILNQLYVFKKKYDCTLISYGNNGIRIYHSDKVIVEKYEGNKHRRFELYDRISKLIKDKKYDLVYIRYPKSEGNFIKLLKKIKRNNSKIIIEIPTYPYNGEFYKKFKSIILAGIDYFYSLQLKKYVDRIVTFSNDEKIFGIKTIRTINGIVFDNIICNTNKKYSRDIVLIGVAIIRSCQGYDRIIEGINNYYKSGGSRNIIFHIVGDGPYLKYYRKLVRKYNLENRVLLHGFLSGSELDKLYDESNIAINSIAIHRIKLKDESTLKTKEYSAKGLPIVSSYAVDVFSKKDNNKYVYLVTPDEAPVQMEGIIEFYDRLYKKDSLLANNIRMLAKERCDMSITLKPIFEFFDLMGE